MPTPAVHIPLTHVCLTAGLLLTIACEGPQGEPGLPGELSPNLTTLQKALIGVGGQEALEGLASFSYTISGFDATFGANVSAYGSAVVQASFGNDVSYDIVGDRFRVDRDYRRTFGERTYSYSEIISGNLGYIDGVDSVFGVSTAEMPSARWGSTRKHMMLTNPHLIYQQILAAPTIASEAGVGLHDGVVHELMEVEDSAHPITLWINPSTGRLSKLSTMANYHLERDTAVEVHFHRWQNRDGLMLPDSVFVLVNSMLTHEEYRSDIAVNPELAADLFVFPPDAQPMYVEVEALWGAKSHQFHQGMAAVGLPIDKYQRTVAPSEPSEVATGVWFIRGPSHNTMVIEQEAGLVVLEAPLYPERSAAILDWIASEPSFDDKPITHAVVTHHHHDHSAGLREFVAAGASAVVQERSLDFFQGIMRAPSKVLPDRLEATKTAIDFETVGTMSSLTLPDNTNPIEVHHIPSDHADDMVIVFLPNNGFLFESDLYAPGFGGTLARAVELYEAISENALPVTTIFGGHGKSGPLSELAEYVGADGL
ncbi:MAG: MBL fold metallo-hydrolase [Proteobacteria bacterium]|nr:MBL fold metallo-hydrolase [Pseudomonadota bacterium]